MPDLAFYIKFWPYSLTSHPSSTSKCKNETVLGPPPEIFPYYKQFPHLNLACSESRPRGPRLVADSWVKGKQVTPWPPFKRVLLYSCKMHLLHTPVHHFKPWNGLARHYKASKMPEVLHFKCLTSILVWSTYNEAYSGILDALVCLMKPFQDLKALK